MVIHTILSEESWDTVPPSGWTDEHKTIAPNYGWKQSLTSYSGGSSPEAVLDFNLTLPNYVFYSDDFSTVGYIDCVLKFKSYIE